MLKIKSAQIPDFTDVDVRRIFGYADDLLRSKQDEDTLNKLHEVQQSLIMNNPGIFLDELKRSPVWEFLRKIIESNKWIEEPREGM